MFRLNKERWLDVVLEVTYVCLEQWIYGAILYVSNPIWKFSIWLFKIKDWSFLNPIKFLRHGSMHVYFRGELAIALTS